MNLVKKKLGVNSFQVNHQIREIQAAASDNLNSFLA